MNCKTLNGLDVDDDVEKQAAEREQKKKIQVKSAAKIGRMELVRTVTMSIEGTE